MKTAIALANTPDTPSNSVIHPALTVALAFGLCALIVIGGQSVARPALDGPWAAYPASVREAVPVLVIFTLLTLAGWLCNRWWGTGRMAPGPNPLAAGVSGLVLGIICLVTAVGLSYAFGNIRQMETLLVPLWPVFLSGTLLILFQCWAEEIFFRGWVQASLAARWGRGASLAVSALLFGLAHFITGPHIFIVAINSVLAGLFFGLLFDISRGLTLPAFAHFGWNWSEAMLLGLAPNPGQPVFGTILDLDLLPPLLLGGSAEGLNASVGVTGVLLTAIVILFASTRRSSTPAADSSRRSARLAVAGGAAKPVVDPRSKASFATKVSAATDVGPVRKANEDSLLVSSDAGIWVVADGMGGHKNGARASSAIVEALRPVERASSLDATIDAVMAALAAANSEIYEEGLEIGAQMGSTVVALIVFGGEYAVVWVGDSRCYLLRDGAISRVSKDHSQVQEMVARGMITEEEMRHHPQSHVLTRAVGVAPELAADTIRGYVADGDIFMLCSDGLSGPVEDKDIAEILSSGEDSNPADTLIARSIANKTADNVTAIVISATEIAPGPNG